MQMRELSPRHEPGARPVQAISEVPARQVLRPVSQCAVAADESLKKHNKGKHSEVHEET